MKYLIFGDIQVRRGNLDVALSIIKQMEKAIDEHKVKAVFGLGDFFETKRLVDLPVFNKMYKAFFDMSKKAKLYFIVGNHDLAVQEGEHSIKSFFPFAEVFDQPSVLELEGDTFFLSPFQQDIDKVIAGLVKLSKLSEKSSRVGSKVLLFHHEYNGILQGAHSLTSKLTKAGLYLDSYDFAFGGHIHKHQKIAKNAIYVGSPFQQRMDEREEDKGFIIFDSNKAKWKYVQTDFPHYITIKSREDIIRNMDHLKGAYIDFYLLPKTEKDTWRFRQIKKEAKAVRDLALLTVDPEAIAKESKEGGALDVEAIFMDYIRQNSVNPQQIERRYNYFKDHIHFDLTHYRNIELEHLEAKNFLSYENFAVNFKELLPVPYAILGVNKDTGGSNGAGKSSILEAIYWALYGEKLRGGIVSSVVRRGFKNTEVNLTLRVNGKKYVISRYREHEKHGNSVSINKNTGDAVIINRDIAAIVASSSAFKMRTILDSNTTTFSKARPAERKEILDQILGFKWTEDKQDIVLDDYHRIDKEIVQCMTRQEIISRDISQAELVGVKEKEEQLEQAVTQQTSDRKKIKTQIEEKEEELKHIAGQIRIIQKKKQKQIELIAEVQELYRVIPRDELEEAKQKVRDFTAQHGILEREIKKVSLQKSKYEEQGAKTVTCENCLQEYKPADVARVFEKKLAKIEKEERTVREQVNIWTNRTRLLAHQLDKEQQRLNAQIDELRRRERELEQKLQKNEIQKRLIEVEVSALQKDLKAVGKVTIEFLKKEITELKNNVQQWGKENKEIEEKVKKLSSEKEDVQFWLKALSKDGFKVELFDAILPMFEAKLNYYLSAFGLEAKAMRIQARKDIRIMVRDREANRIVEYSDYSGGEKNRIDFSILFALHEISSLLGFKVNFLAMDELLTNVDTVGAEAVFELCSEFAEKNQTIIFSVTHLSEVNNLFEHYLLVEMEKGVSQLVEVK